MQAHSLKYIVYLFIISCAFSCKKYVAIDPQGKITPTTVNDYRLLLNNSTVFNLGSGTDDFLTDDIAFQNNELIDGIRPESLLRIYKWEELFYQPGEDDPEWNLFYKQIYTANVAITGLPSARTGTDEERAQLIAEAKVHRAFAYLSLVSLYAPVYDASLSATQPGVPLLLEPTYTQALPRATVAAIYNQVLSDLNSSLSSLPPLPAFKTAPSKAAANALLARTYLAMRDYPKAMDNAVLALGLQNTLLNLNSYSSAGPFPGFSLPLSQLDPDVIFMKAASNQDAPLNLSTELLDLLGTKDLRRIFYTYNGLDLGSFPGIYYAYFAPLEPRHIGPKVSEMMLIKAEGLARAGKRQEALDVLNELRLKRFKPADYTLLTATSDQDAVLKVLQERRRELFARGFRLADLKRLNKEPAFVKTVVHPLKAQQLTLAPGSNRYVYPIPVKVISANPEIEQNQR